MSQKPYAHIWAYEPNLINFGPNINIFPFTAFCKKTIVKGYEWTFLQKNVDFGDCGRFFLWKTKLDIYRMVVQVIYNEYHHCQNKKPVHGTEKIN